MTARAAKAGCCCELLWLIVEMAIADRRVKLGRNFGGGNRNLWVSLLRRPSCSRHHSCGVETSSEPTRKEMSFCTPRVRQ